MVVSLPNRSGALSSSQDRCGISRMHIKVCMGRAAGELSIAAFGKADGEFQVLVGKSLEFMEYECREHLVGMMIVLKQHVMSSKHRSGQKNRT